MSSKQSKLAAEQFLRDSAEIMGKYGQEPKLSGKRYEEVLAETQKTFQALSTKNK